MFMIIMIYFPVSHSERHVLSLHFVWLHFFQPAKHGTARPKLWRKTWRTRSSGWGYKMKVSVQTHWSPFPPSNKTAYRMLPVGFLMSFLFLFRGSFSASWFSWSLFILAKRFMYITIPEYIHKICFNVHLSIIFLRWSNSMQVFKHSVGWLHLCLFLLCNYTYFACLILQPSLAILYPHQ